MFNLNSIGFCPLSKNIEVSKLLNSLSKVSNVNIKDNKAIVAVTALLILGSLFKKSKGFINKFFK